MESIRILFTSNKSIDVDDGKIILFNETKFQKQLKKIVRKYNRKSKKSAIVIIFFKINCDVLSIENIVFPKSSLIIREVECNEIIIKNCDFHAIQISKSHPFRIKISNNTPNRLIELQKNPHLKELYIENQKTGEIFAKSNTLLEYVIMKNMPHLQHLYLMNNNIKEIKIPQGIQSLNLSKNPIEYVDFPSSIRNLDISNTNISQINIHNLHNLLEINFLGCPPYLLTLIPSYLKTQFFVHHRYDDIQPYLSKREAELLRNALEFTDINFRSFIFQDDTYDSDNVVFTGFYRLYNHSQFFKISWIEEEEEQEEERKEERFWNVENEDLDDVIDILDYQSLSKNRNWMFFYIYYALDTESAIYGLKTNKFTGIEKEVAIDYLIHECVNEDFYKFPKNDLFEEISKKIQKKDSKEKIVI